MSNHYLHSIEIMLIVCVVAATFFLIGLFTAKDHMLQDCEEHGRYLATEGRWIYCTTDNAQQ